MRLAPHLINAVPVPRHVPVGAYLERVEALLDDWAMLAGSGAEPLEHFRAFTSRLNPLPASAAWRGYSRLCRDGSPVRLCETLARVPCGPAFAVDPGPYGASSSARLKVAASLARETLAKWSKASAATATFSSLLAVLEAREADIALWPGYSSDEVALHWSVNSHLRAATWHAMSPLLPGLRSQSDATRNVLSLLPAHGYRTAAVLHMTAAGRLSTEIVFRLRAANRSVLGQAACAAKISADPFQIFIRRILHQQQEWQDVRARVSLRISEDGGTEELTLTVETPRYFRTDDEIRTAILSAAADFQWDVSLFRPASRLLGSPAACLARSALALSVALDGSTRLRIFSKTGHYASHD